jgi:putative heme iron utilization protein
MVLYAVEADLGAFWLHLSQLAIHTRDITSDPRVGLMIAENDSGADDPQTLARLSIQGTAEAVAADNPEYDVARALYLSRFPAASSSFALGDFSLYRIVPSRGRYIGGFGEIHNVTAEHFRKAASTVS